MTRRRRIITFSLIGSGIVVLLLTLLPRLATPKLPPLPTPNGYDTFVQAAAIVSGDPSDHSSLDLAALSSLVVSNREALRTVRTGLTQRCVVPPHYATNSYGAFSSNLLTQLPGLKRIAFSLTAEGRLAELEDRPTDAAWSYVDCIRFGNEISRGGPLISRLVGIACENIGYQPLVGLLPELGTQEWANVAAKLEDVRLASVSWDEAWQAERAYMRNFVWLPHHTLISWWTIQPAKRKGQEKANRIVAQLSLLSTDLALRCYLAENGNLPARLENLTPKFLKQIPPDPFSKQPLLYRPQGTNWLLYSVGPNLKDDGGVPIKRGSPRSVRIGPPLFSDLVPAGDIFYDTMW